MVVKVAKQFLHGLSACFDSPKLQLHIGDGFEFLKGHKAEFDVRQTGLKLENVND